MTSGFMGRAIIINEPEDNPRPSKVSAKSGVPVGVATTLSNLYQPCGEYDIAESRTVERKSDLVHIGCDNNAAKLLDMVDEFYWELGEEYKASNGMVAAPRRGAEMVRKIALILSMASGVVTKEHVLYAHAFVLRDITAKSHLAQSNSTVLDDGNKLLAKIQGVLGSEPMLEAVICNKCRTKKITTSDVIQGLGILLAQGHITVETINKGRGDKEWYTLA